MYFNLSCILFSPSNQNSILDGDKFQPDQWLGLGTFFSSLNLRTVSSNSFQNDILKRFTLNSHLPVDNEELNKIRVKNGMQLKSEELEV